TLGHVALDAGRCGKTADQRLYFAAASGARSRATLRAAACDRVTTGGAHVPADRVAIKTDRSGTARASGQAGAARLVGIRGRLLRVRRRLVGIGVGLSGV